MTTSGVSQRPIAGLDTASNRFHLYCSNGFQANLTIPDRSKMDPDERRHRLFDVAHQAFGLLPTGTLIMAEEPLALKNGKTTRLLSLAAGAIWAAHLDYDLWWAWTVVTVWKKEVIGNGNADKTAIEAWVRENMELEFDEQDFYDAAALCRYGQLRIEAMLPTT